jgi:hypothetical protein
MITDSKYAVFGGTQALAAIRARLSGNYDDPNLLKLGPLTPSILNDIDRILEQTVQGSA